MKFIKGSPNYCVYNKMNVVTCFINFRKLRDSFDQVQRQLNTQIRTHNLLLDKLRLVKTKISGTSDAVVNIENLVELIENPESNPDLISIVDRHKPKERQPEIIESIGDNVEDSDDKDDAREVIDEGDDDIEEINNNVGGSRPVIPVLLFSCNRVTVSRALDLLISYRPDKEQFPIIVSQDCGHAETRYNLLQ